MGMTQSSSIFCFYSQGMYISSEYMHRPRIIPLGLSKVAEIKSPISGTLRVNFSVYGAGAVNNGARIYKNGSGFGTLRNVPGALTLFSEELSFAKDDLIQLYIHGDGTNETSVDFLAISIPGLGEITQ